MQIILVIEDERAIRSNLVKILTHSGFQVLAAENGSIGIDLAKTHLPDLIICDILMPEVDGYEVLTALRHCPETVSIPFIFLSAKVDRSDIRQGMNLGADDYLTKPFTAREMIETIHSRLSKKAETTQLYLNPIKQAAAAMTSLAYRDPLTDLPNRILLHHHIQQAIQTSPQSQLAVFCFTVKLCENLSSLEPETTEVLIQAVAERLSQFVAGETLDGEALDGEAMVARLSGLDFGLAVPDTIETQNLTRLAQSILTVISAPYPIQTQRFGVEVAIGIACFPTHGRSANQLLSCADKARRWCQTHIGNGYQIYNPSIDDADLLRQQLAADLESAVQQSQFTLHYQPQISLLSGRIIGVEALIRWQHPWRGILTPKEFIWLAEEVGLIGAIDQWVLQTACTEAQTWRAYSSMPLQVSVNLSHRHLQDQTLVAMVQQALQTTKLNPRLLALEFAEAHLMKSPEAVLPLLTEVNQMGVSLYIDNFGTAASSLSYLGRLPLSGLKVDRSFVTDLPANLEQTEVVKAIIRIAQSFKLRVVAGGVETLEQLTFLQEHGCYGIQGRFYSQPVPASDLHDLLIRDRQQSQS